MKIEKLTDNKIRIIINIDEIAQHKIKLHGSSGKDSNTALIQMILEEAQKQVGFDVKNCKILIDALSTTEDYIIFTLTKYKNEITPDTSTNRKLKYNRKSLHKVHFNNAIYKFSTFEEFCNFCTYCAWAKLSNLKTFAKNISLYEYKNCYYLVILNINQNFEKFQLFYTSISEFSNLVSDSVILKSQLEEHGSVIFKANAIQNGIKYFSNI